MFFIFWGTHRVERKLKSVAAFCPIHHALHDFELRAIQKRSHVYGISVGIGQTVGHVIRTSQPCGYQARAELWDFDTPAAQRSASRLALEARLAANPLLLDVAERRIILTDVLAGATYAQNGPASADVTRAAARPLVAALVLAFVLSVVSVMFHLPGKAFFVVVGLVMIGAIGAIVAQKRLTKGSGKDALSVAADSGLRPIYYTEDDVSAAVATLNNARISAHPKVLVLAIANARPAVESLSPRPSVWGPPS
jgi:hypothetical protein